MVRFQGVSVGGKEGRKVRVKRKNSEDCQNNFMTAASWYQRGMMHTVEREYEARRCDESTNVVRECKIMAEEGSGFEPGSGTSQETQPRRLEEARGVQRETWEVLGRIPSILITDGTTEESSWKKNNVGTR